MITDLKESKCPLCRRELASDEYDAALGELQNKVEESYKLEQESLEKEHKTKLEQLHAQHDDLLENQRQSHESEIKRLESDISGSYKKQLEFMEENYDTMTKQSQKQFTELQKTLESQHEKELVEKEKEVSKLKKDQAAFKKSVIETTKAEFDLKSHEQQQEIRERDIQITRFKDEVDVLKKQLSQSQSELKGEAGELDLYEMLTHAFPRDFFRRQKRGTSSGDLIQQIRTTTGVVDIPIVYDNKSAKTITKTDIEKAKKYRKIHGTNYVLIVAKNLPKTNVPNGLLGQKEGILLVHSSIVVEVAKQIREGIIEISKLSKSKEDQNTKQTRLYEYIISSEFSAVFDSLAEISDKLYHMQSKDERDHQTLWNNRKNLQEQLLKTYNELSSGIASITQEDVILAEITPKKKIAGGNRNE